MSKGAKAKPPKKYKIELHEMQREFIIAALLSMRRLELLEYIALKRRRGVNFDTAQREYDVLLELIEELPQYEKEEPGVVHHLCGI